MTTDRFHKAAKDGLLEVLREATRKECNNKDESGMTPTLWAAFEGHIEALRLLCGRGGEPDKTDYFGNTALHLAAARGHKECVSFLINIGANPYAMDVDGHTAQELAASNNRDDILKYIDAATAKMENNEKKKSKSLKEKAKKDFVKLKEQYKKHQIKAEILAEKELKKLTKEWNKSYMDEAANIGITSWKQRTIRSISKGNLLADEPPRYSDLVGTISSGHRSRGTVYKKALASKMHSTVRQSTSSDDAKIEAERTLSRRSSSHSEVVYFGTLSAGPPQQRGKLADVFTEEHAHIREQPITRSTSQPDFATLNEDDNSIGHEVLLQERAGLFERPGFGNIVFSRSITTLAAMAPSAKQAADWKTSRSDSSSVTSDEENEEESSEASLERFLTAWELSQYIQIFKDEKIDLDSLMLLTESDMKSLGLPLGPYRKLVTAVQERKKALVGRS